MSASELWSGHEETDENDREHIMFFTFGNCCGTKPARRNKPVPTFQTCNMKRDRNKEQVDLDLHPETVFSFTVQTLVCDLICQTETDQRVSFTKKLRVV